MHPSTGYYISKLQWEIGSAESIQIYGIDYALVQCHWHSPSEHAINGKRFALELHMVHTNLKLNKTAVIGVLYKFGGPDSFIDELKNDIQKIANIDEVEVGGVVDPRDIKIGGTKYYRYLGSLTTPPCTVLKVLFWTINYQLATVSKEQVRLLRRAHNVSDMNWNFVIEHEICRPGWIINLGAGEQCSTFAAAQWTRHSVLQPKAYNWNIT